MTPLPHHRITELLDGWSRGDAAALAELLPVVYDELHRHAARYMRQQRTGHTLQTTALVHEAYLRLAAQDRVQWHSRAHFFAVAATAMRQILIDHARATRAAKRGGDAERVPLEAGADVAEEGAVDVLELDEALTRLAELDARKSRIVELRFFGGLSIEEAAETLGISAATVKREWNAARAWLKRELSIPSG